MLYNYFGKFDDILKISIALDKQNLTMHIIACLLLEKMQQNRHQCLYVKEVSSSPICFCTGNGKSQNPVLQRDGG